MVITCTFIPERQTFVFVWTKRWSFVKENIWKKSFQHFKTFPPNRVLLLVRPKEKSSEFCDIYAWVHLINAMGKNCWRKRKTFINMRTVCLLGNILTHIEALVKCHHVDFWLKGLLLWKSSLFCCVFWRSCQSFPFLQGFFCSTSRCRCWWAQRKVDVRWTPDMTDEHRRNREIWADV